MLDAALSLAAGGWAVFPCRPRKKEPLTLHGFKDATSDLGQVNSWWTRWPWANIAGATGAVSGRVTLDVDDRHGGDESLAKLVAAHGGLPDTQERLTGGGGRHIDFSHPGIRVPCSSGLLGSGLDIRGDGGYVLLPPSVHPCGRRYEWEVSSHPNDVDLAPMPDWLLDRVTRARTVPETSGGKSCTIARPLPLGRTALAFVATGAPIGEQRSRAVAAARNLLSAGYAIEAAADAIWQGFRASLWDPDREPWTEGDALAIVKDLATKPAPPPRPLEQLLSTTPPSDFSGRVVLVGSGPVIVRNAPRDVVEEDPPSSSAEGLPKTSKIIVEVGGA